MTDTNTQHTANDIKVESIELISASGESKSLTFMYDVLSIHESLFYPVITGSIQISDGVSLYSTLGLNGTEFLKIVFKKPGDKTKFSKIFRIYACTDRQPKPDSQIQVYVLHFCSEENIFSNQLTISKAFRNETGTTYVKSILLESLKISINKYKLDNFEECLGTTEYTFTQSKPFDAINTIAKYSYGFNGSPFVFFENSSGFNFKSLETLCSQSPITTLNYSTAKAVKNPTESHGNASELKHFIYENSFDIMQSTKNATYSGTLHTLDLVRQKYSIIPSSFVQVGVGNTLLDKLPPIAHAKNRNSNTAFSEFGTKLKYSLTNLDQTYSEYAISKNYKVVNTNVEKVLMQREMHLSMLENTKFRCRIPGNPNFTIGLTVEFNLPAFIKEESAEKRKDAIHSGKYLITGVRHTINRSEGFETLLELSKNSSFANFTVANYNKEYQQALAT